MDKIKKFILSINMIYLLGFGVSLCIIKNIFIFNSSAILGWISCLSVLSMLWAEKKKNI